MHVLLIQAAASAYVLASFQKHKPDVCVASGLLSLGDVHNLYKQELLKYISPGPECILPSGS